MREIRLSNGHTDEVGRVAFSHDGAFLASGSADRSARIWSLKEPKKVPVVLDHPKGVNVVAFSPDDKELFTASADDGLLRFWDWRKGLTIKALGPVRVVLPPFGSVALAPSARTIAVLNGTGEIAAYDTATAKVITQVKPNSVAKFGVIGFSPDGTMLSCVTEDGVVTIWDTTNWNAIGTLMPKEIDERRLRLGLGFKLLQLGFSPDSRVFAFTPDARHIKVVKTRGEWKALGVINADGIVTGMAYSPGGKVLAVATDTDHVSLWEPTTAKRLGQLPNCRAGINCLAFSPDGKKLAAGLMDSTVLVWDVAAFNGLAERKP